MLGVGRSGKTVHPLRKLNMFGNGMRYSVKLGNLNGNLHVNMTFRIHVEIIIPHIAVPS